MKISLITVAVLFCAVSKEYVTSLALKSSSLSMQGGGYMEELNSFQYSKRCLVGLTTDAWNIGQKKYRKMLSVYKMAHLLQKNNVACVEVPMWEIAQGPHYDDLQRLFESFWVPDYTTTDNFLLQFDLVVIPDPVIAKYMVESYYEKEFKVAKKKEYYNKLVKQSWGVVNSYPPAERYEYERIKSLSKARGTRKFPPLATCGEESYKRIKPHGQIEYFSHGVEDFGLHLPAKIVPTRRVLLLRFKNRFDVLAQSLVMRGINVTSAYPVTWVRKDWAPQEERFARDVDVVYLHEVHGVMEWRNRLIGKSNKIAVAACHDEEVARAAKAAGFKDIFYAKKSDTDGLLKTVMQAVEHHNKLVTDRVK